MRYSIHVMWLLPLLGAAALGADDLPQPRKDLSAPPAAMPDLPGARSAPSADSAQLQRLLRDLRSQREELHNQPTPSERESPSSSPLTGNEEEIARLRKRMQELAGRAPERPTRRIPSTPDVEDTIPATPPPRGSDGAIDPVGAAQNYYRAADYEAALAAYRKVPIRGVGAEERAPVMYMIATCLRKLGQRDEAARTYREVAGIKDDPFIADCARWQLEMLDWRKDLEGKIAQMKQRRKALEPGS